MSTRPKNVPPPPPKEARKPTPPPFVPRKSRAPGGASPSQRAGLLGASARESLNLAGAAHKLRDEQVRARVVFFEPQASTNAELDAITQDVIAELDALRRVHPSAPPPEEGEAPARTKKVGDEIQLTAELRQALELLLDTRRGFLRARMDLMSRRLSTLFFETVLRTERWEDDDAPEVTSPEQAMWLAHMSLRAGWTDALRNTPAEPEVIDAALARFARVERELQTELLRRRAPELERLLGVITDVLSAFFSKGFRQDLGDFAWSVVREAQLARTAGYLVDGHKVSAAAFPRFREVFERHFLECLVLGVKEPLVARLEALGDAVDDDAAEFLTAPRVLALVCELMCEAFYDHLQLEGVLDLPAAWRALSRSDGGSGTSAPGGPPR